MDFDKLIRARKSTRKFNSMLPDWRDIIEAIDSARFIPTAGGNYVLKFILVDNPQLIKMIANYSGQDFIAKAHYVVVACSNPSRLTNLYAKNGEDYARQEAGAAIQNFLIKLQSFGLSTCWVGHFNEPEIKKLLNIPEVTTIEALFPVGYMLEKKRVKETPIELDRIIFFNHYGNIQMGKKPETQDP